VRAEYGNPPEELWVRGRSAFLTTYLNKSTLFHTSWGVRYEEQARSNMTQELADLKSLVEVAEL
jgi:predicted metal-dependent HD superfamily phosphohydrolase